MEALRLDLEELQEALGRLRRILEEGYSDSRSNSSLSRQGLVLVPPPEEGYSASLHRLRPALREAGCSVILRLLAKTPSRSRRRLAASVDSAQRSQHLVQRGRPEQVSGRLIQQRPLLVNPLRAPVPQGSGASGRHSRTSLLRRGADCLEVEDSAHNPTPNNLPAEDYSARQLSSRLKGRLEVYLVVQPQSPEACSGAQQPRRLQLAIHLEVRGVDSLRNCDDTLGVMLISGFGQTNNTAQPAATGSLFGNTAAPTTGGGLFGQPQQQQNQQQPASGGLFGNTTGGGLFGAKPATTAPTGGLFGATQPAQQPAQTGSLFGNTAGTSSLFGGQNSTLGQQNQQQNKPAGGLFGGGSLFGNQNQQQQQPGATGGLFGNLGQSQPASTSMFGQQPQQQQQNGLGGSLFGGGLNQSTNMQQQQPTLTASIDQNPYGRNDLFTYSGQKLELGSQTKKPALPPLTASSFRITPSKSQLGKLRGFASPLASSQSPRAGSPALSSSYSGLLNSPSDRYKGLTDAALSPNAFVPRASIKKLTLTPKANGFSNGEDKLESVLGKSALKSSASQNGLATPNRNDSSSPGPMTFNPPPSSRTEESPRRNGALDSSTRVAASERQPKKGEYWCKPKLEKLRQMGQRDLSSLPNFTAGRRGYGEVTFLEPVDLTEVDLNDLLGSIIVFTEMELSVYPDDYKDKPARGEGLNVPAQVSLENCFPKDKATKEPITDMGDPRHARFLKRVKSIPETEFVSYTDDGIWTFKVKHFSRYGLRDSDDESEGTAEATPKKAAYARSASGTDSAEDDLLPPNKGLHDRDSDEDEDTGMDEEEYTDREGSSEDMESDLPSEELEAEEGDGDRWDEPIKSKLGEEGMRKLREMQSSFFGRQVEKFGLYEEKNRNEQAALLRTKRMLEERHQQSGSGFGDAGGDDDALDARAVKVSLSMTMHLPV